MTSNLTNDLIDYFRGRNVLVTGGAGSIGSALVKYLIDIGAKKVLAFDVSESSLYLLERRINSPNLEIFLGDVNEPADIKRAIKGVDIVYHAAALKHTLLGERFPLKYIQTNIHGTYNVIKSCAVNGVEKFVLISTDKAVNPTTVMGATKFLAERLTIAMNFSSRNKKTRFCVVRFGNVFYSKGSVLEIFLTQIQHGGPITITDPNMTRFVITYDDAVKFLLKACYISTGGEIFIPKMRALNIRDLALTFIETFAPKFGFDPTEIQIAIIGRSPVEKIHEELMSDLETLQIVEHDDLYVIQPRSKEISFTRKIISRLTSNSVKPLSKQEIREYLIRFIKSSSYI